MDFGETLLAAQRNQQQKSSDNAYYRAKFEPPKKEQKQASRLSANIQKFLAKKEEEERQKQDEVKRKRDDLLAMRDPKDTRKIQKMLKVIKSANKSVLEEAVDREHTAVTRDGAEQPDQDDYGYESQEAAALYTKMMEKYSKIPDEEKFPAGRGKMSKKDLDGTRERMRAALQREAEPQPRQRKSKAHQPPEREESPPPPVEKKVEKAKVRRPAPPPIDFNQLLKLAEQKKDVPVAVAAPPAKRAHEPEPERPMTKRQRREFEEEQARREARRRRLLEADGKSPSVSSKQERPRVEADKKAESTFTRIPKLSDKNASANRIPKLSAEPAKKAIPEVKKVDRDNHNSSQSLKQVPRTEQKRNIDLNSQNTYRIEKNLGDKQTVKTNRESDIGRSKKEDERSKMNRQEDRGRSNREDGRSRMPEDRGRIDRPQDRGRTDRPEDRVKTNKEQQRSKLTGEGDRGKTSRPEERAKLIREENRHINGQNFKPQTKPNPKQEQLRKPELKEKLLAKERVLFGGNRASPKPNGEFKTESGKYPKSNEQKSKEGPAKPSKPVPIEKKLAPSNNAKAKPSISKPESKSFDFDKHVSSLKRVPERPGGATGGQRKLDGARSKFPPGDVRRKFPPNDPRGRNPPPKQRMMDSDSEYDSEMDDFIDDGDDDTNYSAAIRDIFRYDKSKYRDLDDNDDAMESSFAQQMREEYISKKIGIMEDLEDMRMEAMEKKKSKKRRCISDDDDD